MDVFDRIIIKKSSPQIEFSSYKNQWILYNSNGINLIDQFLSNYLNADLEKLILGFWFNWMHVFSS